MGRPKRDSKNVSGKKVHKHVGVEKHVKIDFERIFLLSVKKVKMDSTSKKAVRLDFLPSFDHTNSSKCGG
jgi:hypothetical protein